VCDSRGVHRRRPALASSASLAAAVLAAACAEPTPDPPDDQRPDGVALCYTPAAEEHPATTGFWAAFGDGDRAQRAAAVDALEAATAELPDQEELELLLGLAHLWTLAEPLPGEDAPAAQLPAALGARDHLRRAYELCPTDHRIAAWLGPLLVRFGRTLNDQVTVDEGLAILDRGIAAYPSFVLFSQLLVYADLPRDSADFQQALAAVVANRDACLATPADPACTDHPRAAHNREGAAIFMGDALAKAGRRDDAAATYAEAMREPGHAGWSFQSTLAERLATVDARVAAFATADPADDPPVAWAVTDQCAMCHTR
jgi:hypothetical protein